MQIEIQMFAAAREAAGSDTIQVDVADGAKASDVIAAIGKTVPTIVDLLPSCRLAVDSSYVSHDSVILADSEVALIPPVSGG